MTTRLSTSSFAGTARTLVAVGTARLASMLVTVRAAAPFSGRPPGVDGALGIAGRSAVGAAVDGSVRLAPAGGASDFTGAGGLAFAAAFAGASAVAGWLGPLPLPFAPPCREPFGSAGE